MIEVIAILVIILIAAILIFATTKPDTFRVERMISIKGSPEKIFPLINDIRTMQTWSPWEKLDPNMKRTYSGPASGQGAAYAWEGNSKIGTGRMEILDSTPPSKAVFKLDFLKPIEGHNTVEIVLEQRGDETTVTHSMFGPSPFISKVMSLFFSMDKMVGDKFAEGLANLKALAEKQ